jgi:serine/threonine-protein kinase
VTVCPNDGATLVLLNTTRSDGLIGSLLGGKYRLDALLGEGGMGAVYRATQLELDREVAIKLIRPEHADRPEHLKRFLRESRLAARLAHPNMVAIQEMGQADNGFLYLVMEYLRGRPLSQVIEEEAPLPPERAAWIAFQVSDALEAAAQQKIVHRDLKPQNILVLDEPAGRDFVKVLDFGLAKSLDHDGSTTKSGAILGTPAYISPEMLLHGESDERSDIYSLGVVLYELLVGRVPFHGETVHAMLMKQAYAPVPEMPATVPLQVQDVVRRMLQKDPDERFSSAAELRLALENASGIDRVANQSWGATSWVMQTESGRAARGRSHGALPDEPETSRRSRKPLAVVGLFAAVAAAALLWTMARPQKGDSGQDEVAKAQVRSEANRPPSGTGSPTAAIAEEPATNGAEEPSANGSEEPAVNEVEKPAAPGSEEPSAPGSEEPAAAAVEKREEVTLRFRARPVATVLLDGKEIGKTPLSVRRPQDGLDHHVEFRRRGFISARKKLSFAESATLGVRLKERRPSRPRKPHNPRNPGKPVRDPGLPF